MGMRFVVGADYKIGCKNNENTFYTSIKISRINLINKRQGLAFSQVEGINSKDIKDLPS